ncbi:MAG TPA: hypothetical protein VEW07_15175 [Solirubrobacterales bacterium]|nr:hypothetical protein [Solirubrobacterales bacterium]
MTSPGKGTSEQPAEPTGVNRLDPWMRRHPQYVAGIWGFFALTSGFFAIATPEEPFRAFRVVLALGWTLLAVHEVRRYRAQR